MGTIKLSRLLNINRNLLLVALTPGQLSMLMDLAAQSQSHIGLIRDDFPLLSNLSLLENIVLSPSFHKNMTVGQAREKIAPSIEALKMGKALGWRKEWLSREELLKAYLLRGVASDNSIIMMQSPQLSDLEIVLDSIARLEGVLRLWVCCLWNETDKYSDYDLLEIELIEE